MTTVVRQICIEDYAIADGDWSFTLTRGKEYITSPAKGGCVTVFSTYWVRGVPARIFAGPQPLSGARTRGAERE